MRAWAHAEDLGVDDRAVVIGAFQSYTNELHPEGVEEHDVEVVRRVTGGGAMFMEGGSCITYSLYAPREIVAGLDYTESYAYLDRWVIEALAKHGVNAWYVPINDITSSKGKIGGAAQKRTRNAVIHHVTMSYDIDADKMTDVLRMGQAKISDKGIASAKKRVDPVRSQTGATREEIIRTMIDTFTASTGRGRAAGHPGRDGRCPEAGGREVRHGEVDAPCPVKARGVLRVGDLRSCVGDWRHPRTRRDRRAPPCPGTREEGLPCATSNPPSRSSPSRRSTGSRSIYLDEVDGRAWSDRVQPSESPDGEDLVEFSGRMCYRSWEPGLNPNVPACAGTPPRTWATSSARSTVRCSSTRITRSSSTTSPAC